MKIAVVVATTGRADVLGGTLARLARQTRTPDRMVVVGVTEADSPPRDAFAAITVLTCAKGLTKQRNRALDYLADDADVVIFFDDDFVPAKDFVTGAEALMSAHPEVAAASGLVLADGFRSAGISFAEADALVSAHEHAPPAPAAMKDQTGAYGCNMIIRLAAVPGARFDENLPLYG